MPDQVPDIIHFIIRCPILLNNVKGSLLGHPQTHITGITRLHIRRRLLAVQHLGQDTRTGRFSHSTRPTKQESVCQVITFQRIFQRFRNMPLSHHFREALRPVLPRRYHILICHSPKGTKPLLFPKSDFRSPLLFFIFFGRAPSSAQLRSVTAQSRGRAPPGSAYRSVLERRIASLQRTAGPPGPAPSIPLTERLLRRLHLPAFFDHGTERFRFHAPFYRYAIALKRHQVSVSYASEAIERESP